MVHSARIGVTRDASYINAAGFCETGFEKQKPALFAVWTFIENSTEAKRSKLGVLLDEASTVGKAYAKRANLKDGAQRTYWIWIARSRRAMTTSQASFLRWHSVIPALDAGIFCKLIEFFYQN